MLLFDSLLITVWLSGLQIFFRFFYNSENLRLNSNKILLDFFTFEIRFGIKPGELKKKYKK